MPSAAAAVAMASRQSRRIINPVRKEYLDKILEEAYYIFNVRKGGVPTTIYRTWGCVTILPCPQDMSYSVTRVNGRIEACDAGIENTYSEQVTTAEEVANDIMAFFNDDLPALATNPTIQGFSGVFISKTIEPSPDQLQEANRKWDAYCKALVGEADFFWGDPNYRKNITQAMREAGNHLHIKDKPWLYQPEAMDSCPACGESIKPGVAVCKTCDAVINDEAARKWKVGPYKHRQVEEPRKTA